LGTEVHRSVENCLWQDPQDVCGLQGPLVSGLDSG